MEFFIHGPVALLVYNTTTSPRLLESFKTGDSKYGGPPFRGGITVQLNTTTRALLTSLLQMIVKNATHTETMRRNAQRTLDRLIDE